MVLLTSMFVLLFGLSGWAVLATGALVASLLAVGASPAAAIDDDSRPNALAATSACVGDATGDMMFSDVSEMHAFRADINCLAYYGVTIGYGDGTFRPNADVSREEMVLFMERSAAVAGADADDVVGDFATTGSDPVHRGDMALLIARLLDAATDTVGTDDDGTFTVKDVTGDDWDYFADSRRLQNRVHDSAASALYELGVAKGTGMGYFSPASTVSRGAMAAFITRALAHTSARPEGVTIQSDEVGGVLISVRDANFQPVANAPVDVFAAAANKVGEAFNEDGTCNTPRFLNPAVGGNADECEIDALDAGTNLSGDYDPGTIPVNPKVGGTTVWAWTGEQGDKVEDGGEGLASINLTDPGTVTATGTKVTHDLGRGVTRAHFGSTVTVTIQLVGAGNKDAVRDTAGNSYTVVTWRDSESDVATSDAVPTVDDTTNPDSKQTRTLKVDASGKVTFTITASDPDTTDRNNPPGDSTATPAVPDKTDRVHVAYSVTPTSGGRALLTGADATATGSSGTGTITFSDERGEFVAASTSVTLTADFLTRPMSGSASNVVTVTVVDQFGDGVRGHLVRLSSTHAPATTPPSSVANASTFPVARETDSSGSVRIGYTYRGGGSTETIQANTAADKTAAAGLTPIGSTKDFYWAAPAAGPAVGGTSAADGGVVAVDLDRNMIVVADSTNGPQLVVYDDNDQYSVGPSGSLEFTSMAAFEEALAADGAGGTARDDTVEVSSYDGTDSGDVARFVLTVN